MSSGGAPSYDVIVAGASSARVVTATAPIRVQASASASVQRRIFMVPFSQGIGSFAPPHHGGAAARDDRERRAGSGLDGRDRDHAYREIEYLARLDLGTRVGRRADLVLRQGGQRQQDQSAGEAGADQSFTMLHLLTSFTGAGSRQRPKGLQRAAGACRRSARACRSAAPRRRGGGPTAAATRLADPTTPVPPGDAPPRRRSGARCCPPPAPPARSTPRAIGGAVGARAGWSGSADNGG